MSTPTRKDILAPCVAVVGPANSGKTSLLHLLDAALQTHPSAPLVYVVKGNPDGTGRYLLHAPELREKLKPRVKGAWGETTVETVSGWIDECRRHLELVLLDFGGRHAPANERMLRRCSHFIVVARAEEGREPAGAVATPPGPSWAAVCEAAGLAPVAVVRSLGGSGAPEISRGPSGVLSAAFRADACGPEDPTNRQVVAGIVEEMLALARRREAPAYVDLRLGRDWLPADLRDVGGRLGRIQRLAGAGEPIVLGGGRAPAWAYGAALHRALDVAPAARVRVFDPKVPGALVEVPATPERARGGYLARSVTARWHPLPAGEGATLDFLISTPDRMLSPAAALSPQELPVPAGEPPAGALVVSGSAPIWLLLTATRWLRSISPSATLGIWDARSRSAALLAGPGSPGFRSWPEP